MNKFFIILLFIFILISCSKDEGEISVIQNELKNKNVLDENNIQKSKQIRADFEKDLDSLYNSLSGKTN